MVLRLVTPNAMQDTSPLTTSPQPTFWRSWIDKNIGHSAVGSVEHGDDVHSIPAKASFEISPITWGFFNRTDEPHKNVVAASSKVNFGSRLAYAACIAHRLRTDCCLGSRSTYSPLFCSFFSKHFPPRAAATRFQENTRRYRHAQVVISVFQIHYKQRITDSSRHGECKGFCEDETEVSSGRHMVNTDLSTDPTASASVKRNSSVS